tara:strand:- start:1154 stop:1540 length:387 start_codon:yes stop_codon:yes gene_type:complete
MPELNYDQQTLSTITGLALILAGSAAYLFFKKNNPSQDLKEAISNIKNNVKENSQETQEINEINETTNNKDTGTIKIENNSINNKSATTITSFLTKILKKTDSPNKSQSNNEEIKTQEISDSMLMIDK